MDPDIRNSPMTKDKDAQLRRKVDWRLCTIAGLNVPFLMIFRFPMFCYFHRY